MKEHTGRAALPECGLCGDAAHPAQTEIRYRGFAEKRHERSEEKTDE